MLAKIDISRAFRNLRVDPADAFKFGIKVKVGVLRPVQQPGSYWDRSSELPLVGLEPTEVTAYD